MRILNIILLLTLQFSLVFCVGSNKSIKMNNNRDHKYNWDFGIAAPKNYPIQISRAFVYFGDEKQIYPSAGIFAGTGLSSVAQTSANNLNESKRPLPNGLVITWVSCVERKVYEIETEFPLDIKRKLQEVAQGKLCEPIEEVSDTTICDYFLIAATLIPGGDIMLNVEYGEMNVFIGMLHGKMLNTSIKDLNLAYHEGESDDEYYKFCETEINSKVKSIPIPYELWRKYCERFEYDIDVDFENEKAKLLSTTHIVFTNAEYFTFSNKLPDLKARIKQIFLHWLDENVEYNAYIYLNENEVLKFFDNGYCNNNGQKGKFVVKVSRYNNGFDLLLYVNKEVYKFENAQIHVWKYTTENSNIKEELHYWNYRNKDVGQYIGE